MTTSASLLQPHLQHSLHRIVGVGNAGVNFLDRLLVNNPFFLGLVAINNDLDALHASVVPTQLLLSPEEELVTALEKIVPSFEEQLQEASVVLLSGGLGGETASTLLPHLATVAKKLKKLTLACVTQPFSFEGKRAQSLALESLSALEQICDGVILVDNNQLSSSRSSKIAVGETFTASDEAMQQLLPNILAMLASKGPVRINRSHLLKSLSRTRNKISFGHGQASGANRLHEAMERLFKTPQLQRGRLLTKSTTIFMQLRGPQDLSFAEAQAAMQELERVVGEDAKIELSVSAEELAGTALQVFILAVEQELENKEPAVHLEKQLLSSPQKSELSTVNSAPTISAAELSFDLTASTRSELSLESKKQTIPKATTKIKQTQGALNFTAAQRGRFDKSEPTIVEGEDLDTPTYLRLGLSLKI